MSVKTVLNALIASANGRPTPDLCSILLEIDRKPDRDDAEKLIRATLIDVLCERHPEAETAFTVWAEDDSAPETAAQIVADAAMEAMRRG